MSDTQILVLTVTFLLAAAVAVPLVIISYRKEQRKRELSQRREADLRARQEQQKREEANAKKTEAEAQARKQAVEAFEARKDRFRDIRSRLYTTPACSGCSSKLVHLVSIGQDTGVLTVRCVHCGKERRVFARSKDEYMKSAADLRSIFAAYQAIQRLIPDYPGLAMTFPEPANPPAE